MDYRKKYKKISKKMNKIKDRYERLNVKKQMYKNLIDVDEIIEKKKEK